MARKVEIPVHRNDQNIHLRLVDDFDGISAHELLKVLRSYCGGFSRVFMHTSCLKSIHPFGRPVFHTHLALFKRQSIELVFTGDKASQLAPERAVPFDLTISIVPPVTLYRARHFALSSTKLESKVPGGEEIQEANGEGLA